MNEKRGRKPIEKNYRKVFVAHSLIGVQGGTEKELNGEIEKNRLWTRLLENGHLFLNSMERRIPTNQREKRRIEGDLRGCGGKEGEQKNC